MAVLPENLPLIREIAGNVKQHCPNALVIMATNPVDPLNYAMHLASGLDCRQFIGYSYNDSIRFRMRLAHALGVASSRVAGYVIGEHGDSQVLLFSTACVDGKAVTISDDMKRKLRQQVPDGQKVLGELREKTGRTAAWTTAVGLTAVCRAIVEDTGEMIPCSVVLDGEYDCNNLSMSVPTILGIDGVKKILEWRLAPDERELLNQSIAVLKPAMKYVEELLHLC
jgi:malate dehydrogenase